MILLKAGYGALCVPPKDTVDLSHSIAKLTQLGLQVRHAVVTHTKG